MRRTIGLTVAWLGATILAVAVAATAVGNVRSQVTDTPTRIGSPSIAALATDTTTTGIQSTTVPINTLEPTGSGSIVDVPTETTTPSVAPTNTPSPKATSTSTTMESITTTSTVTPPTTSYTRTYDTAGGSVRILVDGGSVNFDGAVPKPGWKVEVEKSGPESVEVKFEANNESGEIEFHAELEDGELKISISDD
jgi:hypothetical protein